MNAEQELFFKELRNIQDFVNRGGIVFTRYGEVNDEKLYGNFQRFKIICIMLLI